MSGTEPSGNSTNYSVTFAENGLPGGTKWSVKVNGTTQNATKNQIVFSLPNGTYTYHVLAVRGYSRSPTSGNVTVAGAAKKVTVKFKPTTYTITFNETGLPANTLWSVNMTPSSGPHITNTSTTSNLTFSVANGSYTYSIASIDGYQITSGTNPGTVKVAGGNKTIAVGWSKSPSRHGLSLSLLDYLVIAVVGVWVVVGVVLILRRRRQRASPRLWTPPSSAKPKAPPAPTPSSPSNPPDGLKEPVQEGTPPAAP